MSLVDAHRPYFRFLVLFFNCLVTFGSYFCFDMPSVLQYKFQGNVSCEVVNGSNASGCCSDCLGMSPEHYNLLYAIYAWTNAVVVIGAGFLIDKMGNGVGVFLFSFLCLLGSGIFALGAIFRGTAAMLPIMLIGRLLFGSGNGSLSIVQSRISAFWFRDKELAMAFGATLAFSRLGSVLNFLLTVSFTEKYGLPWTLWGGAILCAVSFLSAISVGYLDKVGLFQRGQTAIVQDESSRLRFTDIRYFSLQYWLLVLAIMFFYSGVFPFVADASKFIIDKYEYTQTKASYAAGAVYFVSMLSPFVGLLIDNIGKRGYLALTCSTLTVPVYAMLAYSNIPAPVMTIWLGLTYTVVAGSLFPSIPLVVPQASVGLAMGVNGSIQMIGVGISNLVVGALLGESEGKDRDEKIRRWQHVMIFLMCNTVLCVVSSFFVNVVDRFRERVLNQNKQERLTRQMLEEQLVHSDSLRPNDVYESSETDPLLIGRPVGRPSRIN